MRAIIYILIGVVLGVGGAFVPSLYKSHQTSNQPYADQQGRAISSLSRSDIEQLKQGNGWGLAKPAEFNGYPGPAHIIELAESLELSETQLTAVQDSFSRMKQQAQTLGEGLIDAERALDAAFIGKRISAPELNSLLAEAEKVRAQLRAVHLAAHLEVTPLLSEDQKAKYAELRGYGGDGDNLHSGHGSH